MYNGPARAMIFAQSPPEFPPETPRRSQLPAAAGGRPQATGRRRQASPDSRLRTPEISSDRIMTDDDEQISTASDGHTGDDNDDEVLVMPALPVAPVARSSRKRAKRNFPRSYSRAWAEGDAIRECGKHQCNSCKGWYSANTNASGWKNHLSKQHGITNSNTGSSGKGSTMVQSSLDFARPVFSDVVLCKFETAVVDYVIGGGVSLRAAGGLRFKRFVASLTDGYEPPSTRTILRRIAELFRIALPMISGFFGNLDVAISLTLDGWSNRNLKGFYIVTAHWVYVSSM
jgi:hypothetical protein